jgi:uncharacterized membrane protein (DUF4010 family)
MNDLHLLFRFAAALAVGILIGLQRESEFEGIQKDLPAGIRTFALLGLAGAASAMVADLTGSVLPLVAVLLIAGAFFSISHAQDIKRGRAGLTTKVASVLTLLIGALCYLNRVPLAVGLAVAVTFLLSFKPELHRFAHRITRADMYATLKFVVVSAVILPVLPDRPFGPEPFNVLNPFKIWLFVVFISGISYAGYILIQTIGPKKGIGLTGFLGGLVSSTALTASFTQRSRENQKLSKPFAFAIVVAWTVMFLRIMVIVAVLNPGLLARLWLPLTVSMAAGLAYSAVLYRMERREPDRKSVGFSNPFELKTALKFAALFSAILLVSAYTQNRFGNTGVLFSGFILGLADVDAVVLSVARLSLRIRTVDPNTAAQAIMLASAANTMLKAGIVAFGGSAALRRLVLPGFVLMVAAGLAAVFLL